VGFPLPAEPDVTQLAYVLVAIPDAPEYRQAVIGHYGELGRVAVWGAEGITDGSYAASQSWLRAIMETYRLLEMGWPDLVLSAIDEVEALLAVLQTVPQYQLTGCCGNQSFSTAPGGATSTDPVPQAVVDAGYATSTSDYEGYAAYKCMVAHLLINNFESKLVDLGPIITAGAVVLSILVAFFAAGAGLTGVIIAGLTVGIGELIGLIDALKDLGAPGVVALADDMETNRDELVCSILAGDGITESIASYKAKVDDLFSDAAAFIIKNLNVDYMFQHYLAAAYGDVDVAAELAAAGYDPADYSCASCEADVSAFFTFPSDHQGWYDAGQRSQYNSGCQALEFEQGAPTGEWWAQGDTINAISEGDMVSGHTYRFRTVRYSEGRGTWDITPPTGDYKVYLAETGNNDGAEHSTITPPTAVACSNRTVTLDVSEWPDFVWAGSIQRILKFAAVTGMSSVLIDSVLIELDDVTP
jgi:hypothetical protein